MKFLLGLSYSTGAVHQGANKWASITLKFLKLPLINCEEQFAFIQCVKSICFASFTFRKSWLALLHIFLVFVLPDKLPNGVTYHTGTYQDRLAKLQDHLRQLSILFRKLRLVYDKCNENCGGMDPIPVEASRGGRGRMNVRCQTFVIFSFFSFSFHNILRFWTILVLLWKGEGENIIYMHRITTVFSC